jgi:GAF domain-containing protein
MKLKRIQLPELPELQDPPESDSPVTSISPSLSSEPLHSVLSKHNVCEFLLRALTKNHNYSEFVREALLSIMRVMKCEAGSILEIDEASQTMSFRSAAGKSSDKISGFKIPLGQGIVGHVAATKEPYLASSMASDTHHLKAIQAAVDFEVRNIVAFPLLVRGQVYGVLELLNRVGKPCFTEEDMQLLGYLSTMLSRAIEIRMMINWSQREKTPLS